MSHVDNTTKNEQHYDKVYANVNVDGILKRLHNLDAFLADATKTDTSWVGMYHGNFREEIKGKKVLELGCGDCTNAAVMAALGAQVYANDISQVSGTIIDKLNDNFDFETPIQFIEGNFLKAQIEANSFDMVIGKAFVHHLTHEQELEFMNVISKILKAEGSVRFFEPAINSKLLDELRWMTPVPGRPSKLQRKKFKAWEALDPHPHRDNSSRHYRNLGLKFFNEVEIIPIGSIERFHRLMPRNKFNRKFRRFAFKAEGLLPPFLNSYFSRSHVIDYRKPKA